MKAFSDIVRRPKRVSERQPFQSVFPLGRFRCEPDEQRFVSGSSHVEALRNEEDTRAAAPGGCECTEMCRYCADVVCNENSLLFRSERKDFEIGHPA